ncbi:MAG: CoF synthetase [Bacteroidetes bacterium]|nr:MAG: CoF synthetase [Bacteroidota bacterium]
MFLNNIRYYGFWLIDALKGFKIKNHLKEIEKIQQDYSSDESQSLQLSYMIDLLRHATSTTDFYKAYKNLDLKKFPVIDKNIIRTNELQFQSKTYSKKQKKYVSSSGSTGATIRVYHDKNKCNRSTADNIYFLKLVGFKVGQKLFYIRIWWYTISKFAMWCKNIEVIDILRFNDKKYILNLIKKLTSNNESKNIMGYASALEQICLYLDNNNYKPLIKANIKSVISIAENLSNYTKGRMKYYFNTPIFSRYSNTENGIFAQQTPSPDNNFVINWASYFIEILKFDEDTPVDYGETGRIIITDLFSYGMPMIRYDTGDVGAIDYSVSPPVFKNIEGRKADVIFNTNGRIVSSLVIVRPHLSKGVLQSQLIQENKKEYIIKLNVTDEFNDELILINEFKEILGNDALIKVKYIDEIPALASGKTRTTINNYMVNATKVSS